MIGRIASWLVGLVVVALATAMTWALLRAQLSRDAATAATAAALLLPPVLVAVLLRPSLRRIDPSARFIDDALGLTGLWSGIVAALVLLLARAPLATALEGRAPGLAAKLRPAPSPPEPAPSMPAPVPSATASTEPPARVAFDASLPEPARPTPTDASTTMPEPTIFARLPETVIDGPSHVASADFDGDGIDEIVVRTFTLLCKDGPCVTRGAVRVLGIDRPTDTLLELFRFEPSFAADQAPIMGVPAAVDANGDGRTDLLLCVTLTALAGGTRGGSTQLVAGRGDRTFAPPAILDRGACTAVGLHDVDGQGKAELVVVHRGNPWQTEQPNGSVAWFVGAGKTWRAAGRLPTGVDPDELDFVDVDADGRDDVIVSHGWESDPLPIAYLAGRGGLKRAPADLAVPRLRSRTSTTGRFDDDGFLDRVDIETAGIDHAVVIRRTKPRAGDPIRDVKRAE